MGACLAIEKNGYSRIICLSFSKIRAFIVYWYKIEMGKENAVKRSFYSTIQFLNRIGKYWSRYYNEKIWGTMAQMDKLKEKKNQNFLGLTEKIKTKFLVTSLADNL